jgi:hypothetical protein
VEGLNKNRNTFCLTGDEKGRFSLTQYIWGHWQRAVLVVDIVHGVAVADLEGTIETATGYSLLRALAIL